MYYRNQREEAEKKAATGDPKAAGTAAKIYNKLSAKDDAGPLGFVRGALMPSENQSKRNRYVNQARAGRKGGAIMDAVSGLNRTAIAGEAGGLLGKAVGSIASRFAPKAAQGVEGALAKTGSKGSVSKASPARQDLGKAKPAKKALESKKPAIPRTKSYEIKGGGTTKPSKTSEFPPSKKALPSKGSAKKG